MLHSISRLAADLRDLFQFAFGDREAVIQRDREARRRAWQEIYHP